MRLKFSIGDKLLLAGTVGVLTVLATVAGASASTTAASNSGSTTQSFQTIVIPTTNPCTGVSGTVTLIAHNVTHMTFNASGGGSFTTTTNGSFSFVPSDYPTDPSYAGHFMMWDGGTFNSSGGATMTFTSIINGVGSDGSRLAFHEVAHGTLLANGTVTVLFDTPTCS